MKLPRWTEAEKAHLAAHYPAISARELAELIQDRTPKAIKHQASRMGIWKCHERLREMGRINIQKRWHPEVFKTPDAPPQ